MSKKKGYNKLSLKTAWLLAAPHTWAASIFPVLTACCLAYANGFDISVSLAVSLLAISILLQSAVNTINDYFDFVKGTDSEEDNVEKDDAVLIYYNIDPKSAKNLAIAFIAAAFLIGIYCIVCSGWIPLAIAFIGVIVIFLYSGGNTPISYLPIGEFVSGFVMGELITFASYIVLTRMVDWFVVIWAIPLMIGIALIMMTNNTCDIEKDIDAKRKTLPVVLGRNRSVNAYHALIVIWIVSIGAIDAIWFKSGLLVFAFMLLASYPVLKAILSNPLAPKGRIAAMSQVCSLNIILGAFYCLSIVSTNIAMAV